jgi:hypothetical protein
MRSECTTNDIQWQDCLFSGDEMIVKYNNEKSKAKVAIGWVE